MSRFLFEIRIIETVPVVVDGCSPEDALIQLEINGERGDSSYEIEAPNFIKELE